MSLRERIQNLRQRRDKPIIRLRPTVIEQAKTKSAYVILSTLIFVLQLVQWCLSINKGEKK